ncbi:hypothetical protein TVAG_300650 [Trichomonas vaginalis G3]|uniref:Uncharacterized protein n=1 Tax=Trichomonas vaginalis (strain ATCC PRA-98 / G3) TaxID=412133 RepID=A2EP45_TRIV3|nr:nuclear chaperone required for maturation and nuclear export of pre-60s ribosome subunits [Trichomonas vaginalis G3]EAY05583.1 hypothetical protein TVAG_300650 [Trichomonas vaginalis G3]KAI5547513.1 nuclear chaperone required for maturation and nuclear export of pre-60s ribosome subunits [Trichomonas vaginalis G3]|eukprot:XP_001317806.1 hypothetical protein [Trichomonas vaginalis G3]
MEILSKLQNEYDKRNLNTEDERKWNKLKEIHPELVFLFDLTETIGWVPTGIDQEEVIKQAKLSNIVSYDKLSSYVTKTDPENKDQSDWFIALMDFSSDLYHYYNLLNTSSCISSLLLLHKRGYNIGNIFKTYDGISLTLNMYDSNALLFDIFDKYLNAIYNSDRSLFNVNNLIEKVNSYINQKNFLVQAGMNLLLNTIRNMMLICQ